MQVFPQGLLMRMQQKELAALKSNNCITGRQVLHMVYDWFRTDEHMSVMYGHADLLEIPWMGGSGQRHAEAPQLLGQRSREHAGGAF